MAAIDPRAHGDPQAERSTVGSFLEFMSQLGGSDTKAVQEPGEHVDMMRDQCYSHHDVMCALVEEVRRLRAAAA